MSKKKIIAHVDENIEWNCDEMHFNGIGTEFEFLLDPLLTKQLREAANYHDCHVTCDFNFRPFQGEIQVMWAAFLISEFGTWDKEEKKRYLAEHNKILQGIVFDLFKFQEGDEKLFTVVDGILCFIVSDIDKMIHVVERIKELIPKEFVDETLTIVEEE